MSSRRASGARADPRRLSRALDGAIDSGCTQIIVDLTDVPTVDSSGIGSLVRCKAALDKNGGALKIVGARPAILHALSLVRLETMFEFYPDENTAAASFASGK